MAELSNLSDVDIQRIAAYIAGQKAATVPPTDVYLHGPAGLLSTPGLDPNITNAVISPLKGLRALLPWRPSNYAEPIKGVLTGVTASTGEDPTEACTKGKTPGNLKLCQRTLPFGYIKMSTQSIDITHIGLFNNRCEMVDPQLMGDPFAASGSGVTEPISARDILRDEIKSKLALMFFAMDRDYRHLDFDGNYANTEANDPESYKEYYGLDYQINTGYRDALANVPCPAVDSLVIPSGGLNIRTNQADVFRYIIEMYADRKYLSIQTGLDPVQFAFLGRYGMFRALTDVWPCVYATSRCSLETGGELVVNSSEMIKMRNDMRAGQYLLIDEEKVPFIIDDFAAETDSTTFFESDLYLVPLRSPVFTGGAITYYEYFNWNGPLAIGSVMGQLGMAASQRPEIYRNGRTLVFAEAQSNTCWQWGGVDRYRLVIEAPFLAARLTDLRYSMTIHERSPIPGDDYFYNGGQYMQNYPQYLYSPRDA